VLAQTAPSNTNIAGPSASATGNVTDGSLTELCKERARTEIRRQNAETDKARLDFELVRLLKCGEAIKSGITFHPDSPYAKICSDVVVRYPTPTIVTNPQKPDTKINKADK